jgi:hypothetical protein
MTLKSSFNLEQEEWHPENFELTEAEKKKEAKREYIAKEFLSTEETYVKSFEVLKIYYYTPLSSMVGSDGVIKITKEDFDKIFLNIFMLMDVHVVLLTELKIILSNWPTKQGIGHLFLKFV